MITKEAIRTQTETKTTALNILKEDPFISKNHLEQEIRNINGQASSGTVSRVYNKHRRTLNDRSNN